MTVRVVIDTNVVLDLLVFNEPGHARQIAPLREALWHNRLQWLATPAMRIELGRVLGYPKLAPRVQHYGQSTETVLQAYDRLVCVLEAAPRAPFACRDPDDQVFIDLACAHRTLLLSKDDAVLCMRRRLATVGVSVLSPLQWFQCGSIAKESAPA